MCGIVGVHNVPDASALIRDVLFSLQHRGEEAAGMAVTDDQGELHERRGMGLVRDVFGNGLTEGLPGKCGVGHVRYSTTGSSTYRNIQPIAARFVHWGHIAMAHNGDIVGSRDTEREVGGYFQTDTDTELFFRFIHRSHNADLESRIVDSAVQVRGSYSLVVSGQGKLWALRDPRGFRPLTFGRIGQGYVAASEGYDFDVLGIEKVRDVEPGEMVVFEAGKEPRSVQIPHTNPSHSPCILELVYFSSSASQVFGKSVDAVRIELGRALAQEEMQQGASEVDYVLGVPASGNVAASGYALERQVPLMNGLHKNEYIGRTFIQPNQSERENGARSKFIPLPTIISGKRIALVDDSIIRGTVMKKIVERIKQAGVKELHVRISSSMVTNPCLYGIDMKTPGEQIANRYGRDVERIRDYLGCDSLRYLSLQGMIKAASLGQEGATFCSACFDGKYPLT